MAIKRKSPEIEDLLVGELTVGGDVLDRALFYRMTQGMDEKQLEALRGRVGKRVEEFYQKIHEDEARRVDGGYDFVHGAMEKERKYIDKSLDSWFRPWSRLAGHIEDKVEQIRLEGKDVDESVLSALLVPFSHQKEFKSYLDREFKGFVSNKCLEYGLDYLKMPQELRTSDLERKWRDEYPYLIESKEWDILSIAYKAGGPRKMTLQEKPDLSNGFIGGDTSWSSFLNVVHGPVLEDGKVTGLGQIDYKDCTNVFVVLDGDRKAKFFDGLSKQQKHSVLERVFDTLKYSKKNQLKNKPVGGPKL